MLALDEQLAQEQQMRTESQQIVQTLQAALTDRATRRVSLSAQLAFSVERETRALATRA